MCDCGQHVIGGEQCEACREKPLHLLNVEPEPSSDPPRFVTWFGSNPYCYREMSTARREINGLPGPTLLVFGKNRPAFQVCGVAGLAAGVSLSFSIAALKGLSCWTMLGITASACLTFLALAMLAKILSGEEQLVYYRHELAIVIVTVLLMKVLGQPVLPYLDVTILGIGTFLVFGRIGCLMAGCCHGRPSRWGVCYRPEHASNGFPFHLVGVRLFPVQALESLLVLLIVLVGAVVILTGKPAGTALVWYTLAYGVGRFGLEFIRGDSDRPYFLALSEAQWGSLVLIVAAICAHYPRPTPLSDLRSQIAMSAGLILCAVALLRVRDKHGLLVNPNSVTEVATALDFILKTSGQTSTASLQNVPTIATSSGIQISGGRIDSREGCVLNHYSFSARSGEPLSKKTAKDLAELIVRLRHPESLWDLFKGNNAVFHLVVGATDKRPPTDGLGRP